MGEAERWQNVHFTVLYVVDERDEWIFIGHQLCAGNTLGRWQVYSLSQMRLWGLRVWCLSYQVRRASVFRTSWLARSSKTCLGRDRNPEPRQSHPYFWRQQSTEDGILLTGLRSGRTWGQAGLAALPCPLCLPLSTLLGLSSGAFFHHPTHRHTSPCRLSQFL